MLFSKDCVVEIGSSGTFRSFQPLDNLKDAFGINEPDPAKAFELVLAAQEEERQKAQSEQITLENIQAQLDALTGAN